MHDQSMAIASHLAALNFNWHSYNMKLDSVYREIFNLKQIGRQMKSDVSVLKHIIYNNNSLGRNHRYEMVTIFYL